MALADRDTSAVQRRTLVVLSATQVLAGVGMATALAVSTLVATRISGSELVGGASLTCVVLGAAAAALVVSRVATRRGRRPALGLGYGVGAAGAAGAALAVDAGSAPAMLVGLLFAGAPPRRVWPPASPRPTWPRRSAGPAPSASWCGRRRSVP